MTIARLLASTALASILHASASTEARAEAPAPDARPPLQASAPAPSRPAEVWRLPVPPEAMRLAGEDARLTWPMFVPAGSLDALKQFRLAYRAAVSVMPEASSIALSINGRQIGRTPVSAPNGTKAITFDVAPGVLLAGWNAFEIAVSQRHRVDCSTAATYELWTELDSGRTGLLGRAPTVTSFDELAAVLPDATGSTPIHLLLPARPSPADLGRAVEVVERAALRGHFAHPVVDTKADETGLQIAVGSGGAVPQTVPAPLASGTRFGTTAAGTPLLILAGSSDAELDRQIGTLDPVGPDPAGSPEGRAALANLYGHRIEPGQAVDLATLGLRSTTFSGRFFRREFEIMLPPDAYLADYGEALLLLDGGYAAGLTKDARLVVRVNGVIDGSLELDRPGGAVLQAQAVHMPLDAFRPGRNRIAIEVQLPVRPDEDACDTLASINAKERFLLLGTSSLSFPPLARVAQFPSLSAAFAGNFRVTPSAPGQLFLPRPASGSISAAATLLANVAVGTGAPSGTVVSLGMPQDGEAPALVVGAAADVSAPWLSATGIDGSAFAAAWPAGPGQRQGSNGGSPETANASRPVSDVGRLDAWGQRVNDQAGWLGPAARQLSWLGSLAANSLRSAGLVEYPDRPVAVDQETTFLVAQGMHGSLPLTLVSAPDDDALARGAATLTGPARIGKLAGRAAWLGDAEDGTDLAPARRQAFFRTQPFSLGNDRLVAAGWLSSHAGWYIGAALLVVLLLGASTWAALTFSRQEN